MKITIIQTNYLDYNSSQNPSSQGKNVPVWLDPMLVRGTVTSHRTRQFSGITWISSARDEKEEEEEEQEEEEEEEEEG